MAGPEKEIQKVQEDMEKRDTNDSRREEAPLTAAKDAIKVDSTCLSIPEVVDEILKNIQKVKNK